MLHHIHGPLDEKRGASTVRFQGTSTKYDTESNAHEEPEMTYCQERVKNYDAVRCVYRKEATFYVGISTSSMGKLFNEKVTIP